MRPHRGYSSGDHHQEGEEGKGAKNWRGGFCVQLMPLGSLVGSLWVREPQIAVAAAWCLITTSFYLINDQQMWAEASQGMQSWQALKTKTPPVWAIFKIIGYVKI